MTLPPHKTTVLEFTLKTPGAPYWSRPDLAIDPQDVRVEGSTVAVTVHSIGAIDAPPAQLILETADGKELSRATIPALKAPVDLKPRAITLRLSLPRGTNHDSARVRIVPDARTPEITLKNNMVTLP